MFKHQEIWFPDGESHFPDWMNQNGEMVDGKGTYQIKKLRASLSHVKQLRTAVDIGGHVGTWSMQLAKRFQQVHAFEPMAVMRQCFERNLEGVKNVLLYACALGEKQGLAMMRLNPADTGNTHVGELFDAVLENQNRPTVPVLTLDSFDLQEVDFIKIDCEGFEHHIVKGAEDTIKRWHPTMIVEQKQHKMLRNYGGKGTPAVDLLKTWGAKVQKEISGDFILTF